MPDYLERTLEHARRMATDTTNPPQQRDLWAQIVNELEAWLAEPGPNLGLFEGEI